MCLGLAAAGLHRVGMVHQHVRSCQVTHKAPGTWSLLLTAPEEHIVLVCADAGETSAGHLLGLAAIAIGATMKALLETGQRWMAHHVDAGQ